MTHDKVVVTCKVAAASSSKVVWWVDDKEETSHVTEKSEPGGRLISNITLNASTWKTLREVKCKVDHPCYPTEEAIQISGGKALEGSACLSLIQCAHSKCHLMQLPALTLTRSLLLVLSNQFVLY